MGMGNPLQSILQNNPGFANNPQALLNFANQPVTNGFSSPYTLGVGFGNNDGLGTLSQLPQQQQQNALAPPPLPSGPLGEYSQQALQMAGHNNIPQGLLT